jgi:hypothetical protein
MTRARRRFTRTGAATPRGGGGTPSVGLTVTCAVAVGAVLFGSPVAFAAMDTLIRLGSRLPRPSSPSTTRRSRARHLRAHQRGADTGAITSTSLAAVLKRRLDTDATISASRRTPDPAPTGSFGIPTALAARVSRGGEVTGPDRAVVPVELEPAGRHRLVESDHGRYADSEVAADGRSYPTIVGPELNGVGPVAAIADSDMADSTATVCGTGRWGRCSSFRRPGPRWPPMATVTADRTPVTLTTPRWPQVDTSALRAATCPTTTRDGRPC